MSSTEPNPSQQPAMSDTQLALIVYILYFVAYVTGITGLIGVIIAHVQIGDADPHACARITSSKFERSGSAYCISRSVSC